MTVGICHGMQFVSINVKTACHEGIPAIMHTFPNYPPGGHLIPTIAEFDADVFAFLQDWFDRLGAEESGLGGFYEARLTRGFILNHYEIDLANLFATEWHDFEHYVEVGAGMGELAFLLGALGFSVIAIEGDRKRFAAMQALRTVLSAKYPGVANVRPIQSLFPSGLPPADYSNSVCFMACVVDAANPTFDMERSILRGMREFGTCVIDLTRFGQIRRSPALQTELLNLLREEGYSEPVHLGVTRGWYDGTLVAIRSVHHAARRPAFSPAV